MQAPSESSEIAFQRILRPEPQKGSEIQAEQALALLLLPEGAHCTYREDFAGTPRTNGAFSAHADQCFLNHRGFPRRAESDTLGEMKRALGITFVALSVFSQMGCGTILNFMPKGENQIREEIGQMRIYGGVVIDAHALSEAEWVWRKLLTLLFLTVEFPLSLAADTATLPITIPVTLSR
jgi:hypothetical protein